MRIVRAHPEFFPLIRDFLTDSSHSYPGIEEWWDNRVIPGLETGERFCLLSLQNEQIAGLSIGKRSQNSAKLCSLRISKNQQGIGLGRALLRGTLRHLIEFKCERVHYTISEENSVRYGRFFESFGFSLNGWARNRYKRGVDELVFSSRAKLLSNRLRVSLSAPPSALARAVTSGCRMAESDDRRDSRVRVLMSVQPKFLDLIANGKKTVEFRRRFSERLNGAIVVFYATHPVKAIQATAEIREVTSASPEKLWNTFGSRSGVPRSCFDAYFENRINGVAIGLGSIRQLREGDQISLEDMRAAKCRPPQSYSVLSAGHPLLSQITAP